MKTQLTANQWLVGLSLESLPIISIKHLKTFGLTDSVSSVVMVVIGHSLTWQQHHSDKHRQLTVTVKLQVTQILEHWMLTRFLVSFESMSLNSFKCFRAAEGVPGRLDEDKFVATIAQRAATPWVTETQFEQHSPGNEPRRVELMSTVNSDQRSHAI